MFTRWKFGKPKNALIWLNRNTFGGPVAPWEAASCVARKR